jgi:hypothetical protein
MTRSLEAKGRRPVAVNGAWKAPIPIKRRDGMSRLSDQIKNEEKEAKAPRPETVNGAWKAPIPIKRRGWMPRLSDQIKNKVAPKEAVSHDQIKNEAPPNA